MAPNLDERDLRSQVTRLVRAHRDTHPTRIAQRFGVSASNVRQQWREISHPDIARAEKAVAALYARA